MKGGIRRGLNHPCGRRPDSSAATVRVHPEHWNKCRAFDRPRGHNALNAATSPRHLVGGLCTVSLRVWGRRHLSPHSQAGLATEARRRTVIIRRSSCLRPHSRARSTACLVRASDTHDLRIPGIANAPGSVFGWPAQGRVACASLLVSPA
ncbi:hypothetical protein FA95DRAFT_174162 [Auriscalpium vulgare]|uniref:Uncharacterized protein n=1 Tax=Auriscalpium vulgare TaxID=40419 RepID=A0ACB8RLX5_9AGAM|nr:hypothetical protein FA95DRAFT_174162 [Auriscalpium vulgare]